MNYFFMIILVILILLGWGLYKPYRSLGARPNEEYIKNFQSSSHYNQSEHRFFNRRPDLIREMKKEAMGYETMKDFFLGGKKRMPAFLLPEIKPDFQEFLKPSEDLKVIWFGHSSLLLNVKGKIVFIDPVFSKSASPFDFMVTRFQPPVVNLDKLPSVDVVLISHDHFDHLDMETMKFYKEKKETNFIAPLGVGSHLMNWGIEKERITELDWWGKTESHGIDFIATPAQHFSGRNGIYDDTTLWASWVIQSAGLNIYYSGDSGYDVHFKEIGEKYGPFDVAFMENGQYNQKWRAVHLLPEETVQAFYDLKAKQLFPIHWGMFDLSLHTWDEPILKVKQASKEKDFKLISPRIGEVVLVNDLYNSQEWWLNLK